MPTLWEILTKKKEPEVKLYNPLNIRVNSLIKINKALLTDLTFTVKSVREVTRVVGEKEFTFADYILVANQVGEDPVVKTIRVIPADGGALDILLLNQLAEFGYHEDFHKGLAHEENKGEIVEAPGTPEEATYWRVSDLKDPWKSKVVNAKDENSDGRITEKEVDRNPMTYWDFNREYDMEGVDHRVLEYYIVEMNEDTGYFTIWVGGQIDPNSVTVL